MGIVHCTCVHSITGPAEPGEGGGKWGKKHPRDKYLSAMYIFYMGTVLPNLGSRVEFLVAQSATRKFEGKLKPESFVKPERKVFITGLAWDNSHNM